MLLYELFESEVLDEAGDWKRTERGLDHSTYTHTPSGAKVFSLKRTDYYTRAGKNRDRAESRTYTDWGFRLPNGRSDWGAGSMRSAMSIVDQWWQRQNAVSEDGAGVGTITAQNTTKDVNKSTPRKNLKAFNLVEGSTRFDPEEAEFNGSLDDRWSYSVPILVTVDDSLGKWYRVKFSNDSRRISIMHRNKFINPNGAQGKKLISVARDALVQQGITLPNE